MSMAGYTKLFNSILASTIWRAEDHTRIVWITLLAMADKDGIVEGSIPGLADFARVPIEGCQRALAQLSAPDEYSRSKEQDGRRIEAVEGGWRLINHPKYRAKMSADERREYLRVKQADYRKRHKESTSVNKVSDTSTLYTHTEAEAEANTDIRSKSTRTKDARDETLGNVTVTPRHAPSRPQPIQSPRRKDAAWEGPRVYVPQRMHRDFLGLRQGTPSSDVELELWAWYATVADEWTEGARKAEEPGADMFAFWRARYAEHWPAAAVSSRQAPARMPSYQGWECPHIEPCNNRSTCEIRTAQGRPEKGGSAT